MALTRRYKLVLAGLAVAGAVVATVALTGEESREDSSLGPAITALRSVPLPAGFAECTHVQGADLCWESDGTEVAAVPVLLAELRRIGATDLTPKCVSKRERLLCRVDGTLEGSSLDILINRNGTRTQVLAFAATELPPDITTGGTPVPIRS